MHRFICRGADGRIPGIEDHIASLLIARGADTYEKAQAFLHPSEKDLHDPMLLFGMDKALPLLKSAIARRAPIIVYGDYDCDGVCASAILVETFNRLGAQVRAYIPHRKTEGYGLNEDAVRSLAGQGAVLITVDCGITAVAEAQLCKELGIDLVITDHHECKDVLPEAIAVVDPHRPDCRYPHDHLCGVGVAFKLACALCGSQEQVLAEYADMVCLGTVADVMPLVGENRVFVARGLELLKHTTRPGLAALMAECNCAPDGVSASSIGFMLAPRINAAGRMGQIELAVELFQIGRASCRERVSPRV